MAMYYTSSLSTFCAGYLEAADEEFYLLRAVSPEGMADGFVAKPLEDIFLVEQDSRDLRRIAFLEKQAGAASEELPAKIDSERVAPSLLSIAETHELIVGLGMRGCDSYIYGYVDDMKGNVLTLRQVGDHWGNNDGSVLLQTEMLDHVEVLSDVCKRIQLLNTQWNDGA